MAADTLTSIRDADEKLNCMAFVPDALDASANGLLSGTVLAVKDNLCVQKMPAQAGSRILEGYVPPFDATAVSRLKNAGALIGGKAVMDEFGFGTFNVNTYKIPKNPLDAKRVTGGSSGGCAAFTAFTRMPSIAESTGGSISAPAAFCGVVGLTPTYGRVSRYGLIDYANSLDKIGVISTDVNEAFTLLGVMQGPDPKDATSVLPQPEKPITGKIALVGNLLEKAEPGVREKILSAANALEKSGAVLEHVSLKYADASLTAYYVMAMSEASTNLAKYCGLRYGIQPKTNISENYTEYFSRVRAQGFGAEAKRRLLLGSYARTAGYRGKYYDKAARVRTLVIREFQELFQKYDVLLTPSMPTVAPLFSEVEKMPPAKHYAMDICTGGANLAGVPHVSVPCGNVNGLPVGLQLVAGHFQEKTLQHYAQRV
ncbi:MAG: amidase family protein [Candidatus Micrarchaeota archaeon]|nr:amidase family protein [Candidatus Micrarchaeota archaeon]